MSASGRRPMRSRLWWPSLFAVGLAVTVPACGRSGLLAVSGGRIQFEIDVQPPASYFYDHYEFCWDAVLDTPQGGGVGADASVRKFPSAPGSLTVLYSGESEELRPGTWQVHVRVTGVQGGGTPSVVVDLNDCRDYNGNRPVVYAEKVTKIVVVQGNVQCASYADDESDAFTSSMGDGTAESCFPTAGVPPQRRRAA
jgi:hypothetical protein